MRADQRSFEYKKYQNIITNISKKTMLKKIFAVAILLLGFGSIAKIRNAEAASECPGTGADCVTADDGTVYYKGTQY